ncbi:MMPL family transporter [Actinoplanes utahensis]|uniref:MMPL family transporter n=3 Tax=Actinoplanes utahensis TaxID=1869 RepID=UPI001568CF98|nr:MMPL family transporter [Actinoplanes utahensis]
MLIVALVAVIGSGIWGLGVFGQLTEGGFTDPGSESARAADMVATATGGQGGDVIAIYTPERGDIDDAELGKRITERLAALPASAVAGHTSYWEAKGAADLAAADKSSAIAVVTLAGADDAAKMEAYADVEDAFTVAGARVELAGGIPLNHASSQRSTDDLAFAEMVSLPIVLILLLIIFGSLVAASLPVLVGGCAVLGSLGVLHLIALNHEVNSFAVNVASLLGLGMAIDYGLFMVGRFREEQAVHDTADAVRRTVATAGRTVVFSATLLMTALAGLLLFPQGFLKSLAYGGLAAVFLAMLLSMTLLPALLAVLGPRVDLIPVRLPFSRARGTGGWERLAGWVLRRPVLVAVPILAALLVLALPIMDTRFGENDERQLPAGDPSRVAVETLEADYPQFASDGVQIVVRPAAEADAVVSAAGAVPGVEAVARTGGGEEVAVLTADLTGGDPFSDEARDAVEALRALPAPANTEVLVGGVTARNIDSLEAIGAELPLMIGLLIGATLVLMFLAFGSILLPIKAVVMSALSLCATFGVLVWIFQEGNGASLLDVTPTPLEAGIVVLMAAVVFGLSTDYEVFLLSRMVEARIRGASTTEAVTIGLTRTGRVISAAALLLIVVTGAFSLSSVTTMRFIGVGMIIALVLDATVVRVLLVPAVLRLLGDASWWAPGPLRRLQEKAGLAEYAGEEPSGRHAWRPAPDDTAVLDGTLLNRALPAAPAKHALPSGSDNVGGVVLDYEEFIAYLADKESEGAHAGDLLTGRSDPFRGTPTEAGPDLPSSAPASPVPASPVPDAQVPASPVSVSPAVDSPAPDSPALPVSSAPSADAGSSATAPFSPGAVASSPSESALSTSGSTPSPDPLTASDPALPSGLPSAASTPSSPDSFAATDADSRSIPSSEPAPAPEVPAASDSPSDAFPSTDATSWSTPSSELSRAPGASPASASSSESVPVPGSTSGSSSSSFSSSSASSLASGPSDSSLSSASLPSSSQDGSQNLGADGSTTNADIKSETGAFPKIVVAPEIIVGPEATAYPRSAADPTISADQDATEDHDPVIDTDLASTTDPLTGTSLGTEAISSAATDTDPVPESESTDAEVIWAEIEARVNAPEPTEPEVLWAEIEASLAVGTPVDNRDSPDASTTRTPHLPGDDAEESDPAAPRILDLPGPEQPDPAATQVLHLPGDNTEQPDLAVTQTLHLPGDEPAPTGTPDLHAPAPAGTQDLHLPGPTGTPDPHLSGPAGTRGLHLPGTEPSATGTPGLHPPGTDAEQPGPAAAKGRHSHGGVEAKLDPAATHVLHLPGETTDDPDPAAARAPQASDDKAQQSDPAATQVLRLPPETPAEPLATPAAESASADLPWESAGNAAVPEAATTAAPDSIGTGDVLSSDGTRVPDASAAEETAGSGPVPAPLPAESDEVAPAQESSVLASTSTPDSVDTLATTGDLAPTDGFPATTGDLASTERLPAANASDSTDGIPAPAALEPASTLPAGEVSSSAGASGSSEASGPIKASGSIGGLAATSEDVKNPEEPATGALGTPAFTEPVPPLPPEVFAWRSDPRLADLTSPAPSSFNWLDRATPEQPAAAATTPNTPSPAGSTSPLPAASDSTSPPPAAANPTSPPPAAANPTSPPPAAANPTSPPPAAANPTSPLPAAANSTEPETATPTAVENSVPTSATRRPQTLGDWLASAPAAARHANEPGLQRPNTLGGLSTESASTPSSPNRPEPVSSTVEALAPSENTALPEPSMPAPATTVEPFAPNTSTDAFSGEHPTTEPNLSSAPVTVAEPDTTPTPATMAEPDTIRNPATMAEPDNFKVSAPTLETDAAAESGSTTEPELTDEPVSALAPEPSLASPAPAGGRENRIEPASVEPSSSQAPSAVEPASSTAPELSTTAPSAEVISGDATRSEPVTAGDTASAPSEFPLATAQESVETPTQVDVEAASREASDIAAGPAPTAAEAEKNSTASTGTGETAFSTEVEKGATSTSSAHVEETATPTTPAADQQATTPTTPAADQQATTPTTPAADQQGTTSTNPAADEQGTTNTTPIADDAAAAGTPAALSETAADTATDIATDAEAGVSAVTPMAAAEAGVVTGATASVSADSWPDRGTQPTTEPVPSPGGPSGGSFEAVQPGPGMSGLPAATDVPARVRRPQTLDEWLRTGSATADPRHRPLDDAAITPAASGNRAHRPTSLGDLPTAPVSAAPGRSHSSPADAPTAPGDAARERRGTSPANPPTAPEPHPHYRAGLPTTPVSGVPGHQAAPPAFPASGAFGYQSDNPAGLPTDPVSGAPGHHAAPAALPTVPVSGAPGHHAAPAALPTVPVSGAPGHHAAPAALPTVPVSGAPGHHAAPAALPTVPVSGAPGHRPGGPAEVPAAPASGPLDRPAGAQAASTGAGREDRAANPAAWATGPGGGRPTGSGEVPRRPQTLGDVFGIPPRRPSVLGEPAGNVPLAGRPAGNEPPTGPSAVQGRPEQYTGGPEHERNEADLQRGRRPETLDDRLRGTGRPATLADHLPEHGRGGRRGANGGPAWTGGSGEHPYDRPARRPASLADHPGPVRADREEPEESDPAAKPAQ